MTMTSQVSHTTTDRPSMSRPSTATTACSAPTIVSQQIALTSETLVRTLERAFTAVAIGPAATLIPAMGHVKWTVDEDGHVVVESTNTEIGVRFMVEAETRGAGCFTLPGRLALDLAKGFPTGPVVLAHDVATRVTRVAAEIDQDYMDQANIITHLRGYDPDEIFTLPALEEAGLFAAPSETFQTAIAQVAMCASEKKDRAILTSICLRYTGDSLVLYTADNWRMARRIIRLEGVPLAADKVVTLLAPAALLGKVSDLLPADDSLVDVTDYPRNAPSHLVLRAAGVQVATRLVEGPHVNVEAIVPCASATRVRVSAARLGEAIRRSGYFVGLVEHRPVKLAITPGEGGGSGSITVSSENEPGDSTSKVTADVTGPSVTIVLNTKYIAEAIKGTGTEHVEIGLNAATLPVSVRPVDGDDLVYVMAPINPTHSDQGATAAVAR